MFDKGGVVLKKDDYLELVASCRDLIAKKAARRVANYANRPDDRVVSRQAAWDAAHSVKWQCGMTHEEAAELDALRIAFFPGLSRYAIVRTLLLAFIEEGHRIWEESYASA